MKKEFLPYDVVRNNALKLAHTIAKDAFVPDVVYVSLRGGAYLGNVLSEYFKVLRRGQRPVFYAAVVAHSYTDLNENSNIRIDGWTYDPKYLRSGDRVLFVDDIFDTGKTINHLVNVVLKRGLPRCDVKVAVHDYKVFLDQERNSIEPDYFCRKHVLPHRGEDLWIHYMSHELIGMTVEEREKHYIQGDADLREALKIFES